MAVLRSEEEFENWKKGRDSLSEKVVWMQADFR